MSTNHQHSNGVDSNGGPDVKILEQLANRFFKVLPNEDIPKSIAGSGISPSALEQGNAFSINEPQTSLPDPHFVDGQIPKSVAGSGISPSLKNTDTYAANAHSQPGTQYTRQEPFVHSPFQFETLSSYEVQLQQVLNNISSYNPDAQLPGVSNLSEPVFYFLSGKQSIQAIKSLPANAHAPFDVESIKADFPILRERVNGRPLIWLDNAATTQKPKQVIDRLSYFYEHENSNIHRAAHELAARATDAYENARKKVQAFLNASSVNEIVFVRGSTEAINLVAQSWGDENLRAGDEIIISYLEHHANIVPWQQLAARKGLVLRVIPVDDDGQLLLDEYAKLLNPKTRLVSFTQVSNALGTVTPAKEIVAMGHAVGAKVLVDGAQAVSHMRVNVQELNCDWYVFSGHKVFGPTGIGVLYGKEALLNETQPWQGGGNMIKDVTFEKTVYQNSPARFEAGTGNIADAVGLGAAIDYVTKIGIDLINEYEHYLLVYATNLLKQIKGLRLIGTAAEKAGVLSFVLDGFKTEEVGAYLNKAGIAVRSGHHCAQPILRRFGVESTVRPSLAVYNTCADIDALVDALYKIRNKVY
ncbi:cysteine desulfurase [Niastella caeni]|uniref:cysteine desulfurase n=1 Tax=Niastella caeni TaxID=2569763 RepID=A0A4S8I1T6_9BACT|nr:family 2A encapsulin nanocompartment cargo protein cysteine desulfurase [Niastella caeni]THU40474.1 cysteine desulfurase [Niastella caeni]